MQVNAGMPSQTGSTRLACTCSVEKKTHKFSAQLAGKVLPLLASTQSHQCLWSLTLAPDYGRLHHAAVTLPLLSTSDAVSAYPREECQQGVIIKLHAEALRHHAKVLNANLHMSPR